MTAVVFWSPSGMAHLSQNVGVERQADMRQGRSFTRGATPDGESRRSDLDRARSSNYPRRDGSRFSPARCVNLLGLVGLVALSAFGPACAPQLDTSRPTPKRGTVGEEM